MSKTAVTGTLGSAVDVTFLVMLSRAVAAVSFAELLKTKLEGELADEVRRAVAGQLDEHKHLCEQIRALLRGHVKGDEEFVFDWEGNGERARGTQQHSYPLLGTWAHPDAAVLRPFTCAIEFDREPAGSMDWSHFKSCLMKSACHVLCRAYDATLFVFTLRRPQSTPAIYLDDESHHTAELLGGLRSRGLVVAIVPPA